MHLEVTQIQGSGFTEVAAVHKGERLVWSVGTYGKVKLNDPLRVFDEINAYWAWMGADVQEKVWEQYKELKHYLEQVMDPFHISKYLRRHIVLMYQAMPLDSFSKWLLTRGNLYIPSDIQDTITADAHYNNAEQTYLKADYINLAALSLALRPMLPVWGEYIDQGGQGVGNDLYKEMEAVGLINETEITNWPVDNPAFDKLHNYIRITTEDTPITLGRLWEGMGSAEIPIWLQAKVLVRRLTIVPLCDHSATHSIIANVYRYVKSNLKPTDRRTTDRVNEKRPEGEGRDEDDKTSLLEGYKVKQRIAHGDAVLFTVFSENMAGLAQRVDPTVDLKLLDRTIEVLPDVAKVQIHEHQIRLAQWVLAKAYSPRAFYHIPKAAVNRLLATAQALLWHWGYMDIACLLQVERINTTDQEIPGITQQPRSSTRISRKYVDELMLLYPHVKPQKAKANDPEGSTRNGNVAALGINNLTRLIMAGNWYYHGPRELRKLAGQPEGRGLLVVAPTIKSRITELVIDLAKLNR
jgi:hypothetical protein